MPHRAHFSCWAGEVILKNVVYIHTTFFMLAARGAAKDGQRRGDGIPIYPNTKTANLFVVFVFGLMEGGI